MLAPSLDIYKGEIQYLFEKETKTRPGPGVRMHGRVGATWYKILAANSTYPYLESGVHD